MGKKFRGELTARCGELTARCLCVDILIYGIQLYLIALLTKKNK